MSWDYFIDDHLGWPVMYVKRLVNICGWRIELHKITRKDQPDCYHTHPYNAWRWVLIGGYVEEMEDRREFMRQPFYFGRVTHDWCHRVNSLLGSVSYSLWFHGPSKYKIERRGKGWPT